MSEQESDACRDIAYRYIKCIVKQLSGFQRLALWETSVTIQYILSESDQH